MENWKWEPACVPAWRPCRPASARQNPRCVHLVESGSSLRLALSNLSGTMDASSLTPPAAADVTHSPLHHTPPTPGHRLFLLNLYGGSRSCINRLHSTCDRATACTTSQDGVLDRKTLWGWPPPHVVDRAWTDQPIRLRTANLRFIYPIRRQPVGHRR
jgi:hypothetical protein